MKTWSQFSDRKAYEEYIYAKKVEEIKKNQAKAKKRKVLPF